MKIKLAVLDGDKNFLGRLSQVFSSKYPDKIELYSFTDYDIAVESIKNSNLDVFLADVTFNVDNADIPTKCGFGYLTESIDIESVKNEKTICKYQKVELIYKGVLEIYAEKIPQAVDVKLGGDISSGVISFVSASGGVGSSTISAACARAYAQQGKKVLYINLEEFSGVEAFFSGEGNGTFLDIIFAIKGNKSNLGLKIESTVRKDSCGVYFFADGLSPLDMRDLSPDEIGRLITNIQIAGIYDLIIVDSDFNLSEKVIEIFQKSLSIVFVSDGTEISNIKLRQALLALEVIEKQKDTSLIARAAVIYNKFSNKSGRTIDDINIRELGGAPKYESTSSSEIAAKIQELRIFEKLI